MWVIANDETGDSLSIATRIGVIPPGFTALPLGADDSSALLAGLGRWDAATRSVIPRTPPMASDKADMILTTDRSRTLNVLAPPGGLPAWVPDGKADNTAAIRASFEWANAWVNDTPGRGMVTIFVPYGTYRHAGVDLSDLIWDGLSCRIILRGEGGLRRSTLSMTNGGAAHLTFAAAWFLRVEGMSFYQGLNGLNFVNCQYVDIEDCTFEQQHPSGASLRVQYGQNIRVGRGTRFLQSHSAFAEISGGAKVYIRDSTIGEAAQGARVIGSELWIQSCAMFGIGVDHSPANRAVFEVSQAGRVVVSDTRMVLEPDVERLFYLNSPGGTAVRGCEIYTRGPLTIYQANNLSTHEHPAQVLTGNGVHSAHSIAIQPESASGGAALHNAMITGNVWNLTSGATLTTPPAMLEGRNNLIDGNLTRATA